MPTKVKNASSTWSGMIAKAKTSASTWTVIKNIYVKTSASTWTTVFGSQDVRPTATQDNTTSGSYGFSNPSSTYDNSLGDTDSYGYSSATSTQTIGQDSNCSPTLDGEAGSGFTIFSFDSGDSIKQNEAIVNIKYRRSGSYSGDSMFLANTFATISYSTDATDNTGTGNYSGLVGCDSNDYDVSVQTLQQSITGPLNRQNFKIKVSASDALFVEQTGLGDCNSPPPYNSAAASAGFLIYDIYVTFR